MQDPKNRHAHKLVSSLKQSDPSHLLGWSRRFSAHQTCPGWICFGRVWFLAQECGLLDSSFTARQGWAWCSYNDLFQLSGGLQELLNSAFLALAVPLSWVCQVKCVWRGSQICTSCSWKVYKVPFKECQVPCRPTSSNSLHFSGKGCHKSVWNGIN